jgi:malate synthase
MQLTHRHLTISAPDIAGVEHILSPAALDFIDALVGKFEPERQQLLARRTARQTRLNQGELPDFLPETLHVRENHWRVATIPNDLLDRRVEITGPVECKMVINALNSGASMFMADFEDSNAPSWRNVIEGQLNMIGAVRRDLAFTSAEGKAYRLNDQIATLLVRPRGWHLDEAHVCYQGQPISGALFDFGLYLFHNAKEALARGTGAYFYLPKLESHLEARLWNRVMDFAEHELGLAHGSSKCTVLIETILAAFEMDEILFELRDHIVGLNCGRWDYIFSYIRAFQNDPTRVLPERAQVTMAQGFLRAYSQALIQTCHRRGAFAMGGMAAQIPIKNDEAANTAALNKVRADKEREASDGHDGTWVAHPALVPIARGIFDAHMPGPNQLSKLRADVVVRAQDLLAPQAGSISETGLRNNINVGLQYLAAWLGGSGCVPIHNLMEDAATAEISRAQLWHWHKHQAKLDDGRTVDRALIEAILTQERAAVAQANVLNLPAPDLDQAGDMLRSLVFGSEFPNFLTLAAYRELVRRRNVSKKLPNEG